MQTGTTLSGSGTIGGVVNVMTGRVAREKPEGGTRVEIKGVPRIPLIPDLVHYEAFRQRALLDIRDRLAEMARRITVAQLMSLRLGRLKDEGKLQPAQVSLAKWNNCRAALDIARDARDILGGSGISAEYVPIRHALNLESVITYEGTETIHQLIVGHELTGVNAFG